MDKKDVARKKTSLGTLISDSAIASILNAISFLTPNAENITVLRSAEQHIDEDHHISASSPATVRIMKPESKKLIQYHEWRLLQRHSNR
ncbi:hypothetical protein AYI69_g5628 [Smittium culicis]|uniref:Uncharacterized protein n=1 Tax=Smittium culicis TaxID=133412 RepID=A0A1R1Y4J6_9FUNG|nr:hypothetical protein AYI69_g5628 [Smittium culicis]